jgi:hypothetical protein
MLKLSALKGLRPTPALLQIARIDYVLGVVYSRFFQSISNSCAEACNSADGISPSAIL